MATQYTKWPQNIQNGHTIGIPNVRIIDQMATKYTNIFHCKTLQNLPKLGFLVRKYAVCIWQPRSNMEIYET
jgi:hypothetical protein